MAQPQKLRLEIPLLLPALPQIKDHCVTRLIDSLEARDGIATAHVADAVSGAPPELCIHYDPSIISLGKVQDIARAAGAELTDRFGHLLLRMEAMHVRAARSLTAKLQALQGVVEAEANATGTIRLEFDRRQVQEGALRSTLSAMGIAAETRPAKAMVPTGQPLATPTGQRPDHAKPNADGPSDHAAHEQGCDHGHDHSDEAHGKDAHGEHAGHEHAHTGGVFGEKSELIFALLAGALLLAGWLLQWQKLASGAVSTACFVLAYAFGGYFTLREAIDNMKAKRFEIDTLMLVAAVGAAALGQWLEGALLLFLFSLGHSLEHYAMGRARRAIEALAKLAPETALVRRDGKTEEVPVAQLQVGDTVIVRPNERLPADGFVVVGQSSVNQAPVTGESVPVDKRAVEDAQAALQGFDKLPPQHRVFAGTINGPGVLEVMVARQASESTMARVVKLVTEAETQRSPTQNFTEKFERIFVPLVLLLVGVLLFAWVVVDEPFSASFYRAMAVLVAASPCALAISVPSAVLSGVARAGRGGVLIKGGGPLENLGTLTAIAFDKTGTLTEGKPKLTDVIVAQGIDEKELLAVALGVEEHSDHPLAAAVVNGAKERLGDAHQALDVQGLESITGRGVKARIGADEVYIGKPILFDELKGEAVPADVQAANERLVADGRTTMIVRHGARYLGVLGMMDTPRPVAAQVMRELQKLGIKRLVMISGDNQKVAESVAKSVGLTEARGDLMPEDKVTTIKELRASAGKVAMVGDGVNDAPAMANATVGIAMGAAGSDVALETADVALMSDDLAQLPFAVGLSRQTSRIIRQNLWVSLGVVAVLIPATILGLKMGAAVLFHEGSTLLVVVNALRLLAFKRPESLEPTPAKSSAPKL
ncbi:heavy metal translocating P-type ATPase [Aquabacterium sp. CECT 9606]|uniref:heavy metal translocating P-type ATPase n=1 Tax=Aquabacterium sp. CECT 9606 TaxID=2845822 RepID=UPI001E63CC58|nr:heavy metal translocating P-type ATPase [Aquabacterium sp. CECT 9606]